MKLQRVGERGCFDASGICRHQGDVGAGGGGWLPFSRIKAGG